ncbi:MAG: hypothetical protein A2W19_13990 [Spirochaetes bacterium RBG_16_49_21]|nr:MAG: hypothetical protein A2W19_13990 [Spirochaetes bacterium RBG_16_49_21]
MILPSERFRSIGWKAKINNESCNACKLCISKCPVNAISIIDGHIVIDEQTCLGCGFCAANCKQLAIKLSLQTPLKGKVQDYFIDGGLSVDI